MQTNNGQGIALYGKRFWSSDNEIAGNVVVFCVHNSKSYDIDNPKNKLLVKDQLKK